MDKYKLDDGWGRRRLRGPWPASAAQVNATNLVEGKTAHLDTDDGETDNYSRLPRYALPDGQMVNELPMLEGYAHVATLPPDLKSPFR